MGPEFLIHYKFAIIIAMCMIAFLYGSVMPILFPMTLVGLYIMYTVERLMVYYSY